MLIYIFKKKTMKNPTNRLLFFKYLNYVILISSIIFSFYSFKNKNSQNKNTEYSVDLIGFLGKYPISMHLDINEADEGDVKYVGFYGYNRIGKKNKVKRNLVNATRNSNIY
jgi:hypothetical protein